MEIIGITLALYFFIGCIALLILELTTHRISKRLKTASYDTHDKLAKSGNMVGEKTARVLTVLALIMFWWVAIYGALSDKNGGENEGIKKD